jgi:hypothetical protein
MALQMWLLPAGLALSFSGIGIFLNEYCDTSWIPGRLMPGGLLFTGLDDGLKHFRKRYHLDDLPAAARAVDDGSLRSAAEFAKPRALEPHHGGGDGGAGKSDKAASADKRSAS